MSATRSFKSAIPNAVTSANLLLGFFSILASMDAVARKAQPSDPAFAVACWLILWAAIGDVLDGKLAKLLRASSDFGMRLDTFADAVTFGLAPAVLIHAAFMGSGGGQGLLALAPAAYFLAASFRLARYNVQTAGPSRFGFVGLPTPAAAMISTSLYLATKDAPLPAAQVGALLIAVALAMVSPIRYPAFKGLRPREVVLVVVMLFVLMGCTVVWGTPRTVFGSFGSFALVWGPLWVPTRHLWVPGVQKGE